MPGLNDQFAGYENIGEFIHLSFDFEVLSCYCSDNQIRCWKFSDCQILCIFLKSMVALFVS